MMASRRGIATIGKKNSNTGITRKPDCFNDNEVKDGVHCDGSEKCMFYKKCCLVKKQEVVDDSIVEIDEMLVKDAQGNIQIHKAQINEDVCDFNAGDYLPGDPMCDAPCPLRNVCALNAMHYGRIEITNDEYESLKGEVKAVYYDQYSINKKKWKRSQYGKGKIGKKKSAKIKKSQSDADNDFLSSMLKV
jgi:hypothetical protein